MTAPAAAGDTGGGAARFAARFPRVWHVAEGEGAAGIRRLGLLPATAIRDRLGLGGPGGAHRDGFEAHLLGGVPVVLRFQQMPDRRLAPSLAGGAFAGRPEAWRRLIDAHVFFWTTAARRDRFAAATRRERRRQWRGEGRAGEPPEPLVLALDTAALLARHGAEAWFSRINSGSALRGGARTRRDEATFRPVSEYAGPVGGRDAAELAVRGPVPRLEGLVVDGWAPEILASA